MNGIDAQEVRYEGSVTNHGFASQPNQKGLIGTLQWSGSVADSNSGVLRIGAPLSGSGAAAYWTWDDTVVLGSISPTGDTIFWLGRIRGDTLEGEYAIAGGSALGQGGTWRMARTAGPPFSETPDTDRIDLTTLVRMTAPFRSFADDVNSIGQPPSAVDHSGASDSATIPAVTDSPNSQTTPPERNLNRIIPILVLVGVIVLALTWFFRRAEPIAKRRARAQARPGSVTVSSKSTGTRTVPAEARWQVTGDLDEPAKNRVSTAAVAWLGRNAFRTLGLPGDATMSAIYDADQAARRSVRLGTRRRTVWDLDFISEPNRSDATLRDAVGRLANPLDRVRERLFWVHQCPDIARASAHALDQLASLSSGVFGPHDSAFFTLLHVCVHDPLMLDEPRWLGAIAAWTRALEGDGYWAAVVALEATGGFSSPAAETDITLLRREAFRGVADVLASIARTAIAVESLPLASRALRILTQSALPGRPEVELLADILNPLLRALETLCEEIATDCAKEVVRLNDASVIASNVAACSVGLARFDSRIPNRLDDIIALGGLDSAVGRAAREAAAICLRRLATDFTWGNEFATAGDLLNRATEVARGLAISAQIETERTKVQATAAHFYAPIATIDINGTPLIVHRDKITFGNQSIVPHNVRHIKLGIFKRYTNGLRTSQSYCVWLSDGSKTMTIECAAGWLVPGSVIETRWKATVGAIWTAVVARMLDQCINQLRSGDGFEIGNLRFDKRGVHRVGEYSPVHMALLRARRRAFGGASAEERQRSAFHAEWKAVSFRTAGGSVTVFNAKKVLARFVLRETWNAVLIEPLLSHLFEEGRLWAVIQEKST
ncbi:MAG TPA: hypothetical protein VGM20_05645 [Gemmatimonadales bacterium]